MCPMCGHACTPVEVATARADLQRADDLAQAAQLLLERLDARVSAPTDPLYGQRVGKSATPLLREALELRLRHLHVSSRQLGSTWDALARALVAAGTVGRMLGGD